MTKLESICCNSAVERTSNSLDGSKNYICLKCKCNTTINQIHMTNQEILERFKEDFPTKEQLYRSFQKEGSEIWDFTKRFDNAFLRALNQARKI